MNKLVVIGALVLAASALAAPAKKKGKAEKVEAKPAIEAPVEGKSGSTLQGKVRVSQDGKSVTVKLEVEKAPPGMHAVHLHETGDCSAPDAKSAGGHWNPMKDQHGEWGKEHHHLGDIGNMSVGPDGKGVISLTADKWTVGDGGPADLTGRALVVHEKVDDFITQPTGNAGGRIGCAVLGQGAAAPAAAPAGPKGAAAPSAAPAASPAKK